MDAHFGETILCLLVISYGSLGSHNGTRPAGAHREQGPPVRLGVSSKNVDITAEISVSSHKKEDWTKRGFARTTASAKESKLKRTTLIRCNIARNLEIVPS
jgi:hypothetical protein